MSVTRKPLPEGTIIRLPDGFCAEITGNPLGEGGGSLLYPAVRVHIKDTSVIRDPMHLAIKECFPVSEKYRFRRDETGGIVPERGQEEGRAFLASVQAMQRKEADVTGRIYNVASRMIPVLETADEIELSEDAATFRKVKSTVTVMESLTGKGVALKNFIRENKRGTGALTALRIIEQVLYALREVHEAGYLHLDIQDGNIFLKGDLKDASLQATLIDFGSSRPCQEDGLTAPVANKVLFTTRGFSAPEMKKNDGSLRLSAAADIYSTGYLLLLLLTGKRYEQETIAGMHGRNILTPLRMRQCACPAYLAGSLQDLLSRSLAADPGARYASASEMLTAVTRLREALEPGKSTLQAVRYDAFICYRHGEPDSPAVKTLQAALEHFSIPAEIRKLTGKKRFERVFTDLGELSACADLGMAIRDALAGSEWLIVVCSKATPESNWVSQEIETFLENHDRSHIIPVLIEGEPDVSFPDEIRNDHDKTGAMLAADARAHTKEEMVRIIKRDTVLRVAAPMLGVSYDALKQRRRIYTTRRAAVIAASAALLMAGITAQTLYQSGRIKAAHRETLIRQGELLAEKSEELLKQGDRMGAIRTALEALPESSRDTSKPVTDEAVYALNRATYTYWDSAFACFQSDGVLTQDTTISGAPSVSPDGSMMAAKDSAGQIYVYELASMRQKDCYALAEIDNACAGETLSEIRFLSENRLLLKTDSYLICWDPEEESLIWKTPITADPGGLPGYSDQSLLVTDDDRQRFYLIIPYGSDENWQAVYSVLSGDLKTGTILHELDIPVGKDDLMQLQKCTLSEDGRLLILGVSTVMDERPCALIGIDLESGTVLWKTQIGNDTAIQALLVPDEHTAAVLTETHDYESGEEISHLQCLSLEDGSLLYEEKDDHMYLRHLGVQRFQTDEGTKPALALWQEEHLKLLSAGSFQTLQEYQLPAPILGAALYNDNSLIAVLADGSCWRVFINSHLAFFSGSADGTFSDAYTYESGGLHFLVSGYSSNRLIAMSEHDYEGFVQPDINAGDSVNGVAYMRAGDDWFRILYVTAGNSGDRGEYLAIGLAGSADTLYRTDSNGYKTPICIGQAGGEPALYYLQKEKDGDDTRDFLCAWGLKSNALLGRSEALPDTFNLVRTSVSDTCLLLYQGNELQLFSIDGSRSPDENLSAYSSIVLEEGQSIWNAISLPDNTGFLAQIHVNASDTRAEATLIKTLAADTCSWTGSEMTLDADSDLLTVSPDCTMAVCREENLFVIRSLVSGDEIDVLPEACSTKARAYFADDRYLLIWGDSGYLKTWDLSRQEIVMTDDTELSWISGMGKNGEYLQIHTQSLNEDILFSRHSADPTVRIYKIKDDGSFTHYFDFAAGVACMEAGEITSLGTRTGIARILEPDQLLQRARELLNEEK